MVKLWRLQSVIKLKQQGKYMLTCTGLTVITPEFATLGHPKSLFTTLVMRSTQLLSS